MRWSMKALTGLVGLCFTCQVALAARDRHVVVVNDTSQSLIGFFASNIGVDNWQENIIRGNTIEAGGHIRVNIYDGTDYCHYDLKAVFSNGESAVRRNVDVCTVESWTIHDDE